MGLDQFAKIHNTETGEERDIAYWRKHNSLHGWMENLWKSKGCPGKVEGYEEFNVIPLKLTKDDIDQLAKDCFLDLLPKTTGYFFGEDSRYNDHKMAETKKFIEDALSAIENGYEVSYLAWW